MVANATAGAVPGAVAHARTNPVNPVNLTEPSRSRAPVLQVRALAARFGPVVALDGVDLDVRAGEIVGIAGDNGAGKSTLLRSICGDIPSARGHVWLDGWPVLSMTPAQVHVRVGVVWQHVVLSDNLDVAANLTLGKERRRLLRSESARHAHARALLDALGLPIADTGRPTSALTVGERQLLAVARAVSPPPRLLLLDEPTAVLNHVDSVRVEQVTRRLRDGGTTVLLVSHDLDQLFRLCDRIVVLRRGRTVAEVDPAQSHPDELMALMAGHDVATVARRQLGRLHALASQLSTPARGDATGAATELSLILSTLGTALGARRLSLHVLDGGVVRCVGSVGMPAVLKDAWQSVPLYATDNPLVAAVADNAAVVVADASATAASSADSAGGTYAHLLAGSDVAACWAVPFSTGAGLRGAVGVYRTEPGAPGRDELDLVNLYAGYAAAALERERLLAELTVRNTVLETIRAILQTLAGPASLADGLQTVLHTLRDAVHADDIGLYVRADDGRVACRASASAGGADRPDRLAAAAAAALHTPAVAHASAQVHALAAGGSRLALRLAEATVLIAEWDRRLVDADDRVLLEDAGHSIHLALERERTEIAHREVAALLRTRELQRSFLARLSHELRTPLTAIHGYASSLMQTDVTWDEASRHRFLTRIAGESDRLGRLVADLLDFSMIESGMLRVRPDWVDLPLVVDAAVSCLSPQAASAIRVHSDADVPAIWADHDRVEQMLVNLMDNAVRHNPPGTVVRVGVRRDGSDGVAIEVVDDGAGMPADGAATPGQRSPTAGAGLGLLITRGIVDAHHGTLVREPARPGTRYVIRLPVEPAAAGKEPEDA